MKINRDPARAIQLGSPQSPNEQTLTSPDSRVIRKTDPGAPGKTVMIPPTLKIHPGHKLLNYILQMIPSNNGLNERTDFQNLCAPFFLRVGWGGGGSTVPTPLILMLHHSVMPCPPRGLTILSLSLTMHDSPSPSELPHYSKFSVEIAGS